MIYTYKHLPHTLEEFHIEILYFFNQLISHDLAYYDESILLRHEFVPIVNLSSSRLKANLVDITKLYHILSPKDKGSLKKALHNNCKLPAICTDKRIHLVRYDDFQNQDFAKLLKNFLTMLWEEYPQNQLAEDKFGTIQSHFEAFIDPTYQRAFVCPFCGLLSLKPKGVYRNAYDHFIPKAMYPFVSINFQNLFPICHDCNSDEKKDTDTLYSSRNRRRTALHPLDFNYNPSELDITISLYEIYGSQNLKTLLQNIRWDYDIKLKGKVDRRLVTWDEVFHIKRRYKEHVLQYEKTWFEDIILRKYKQDIQDGLNFKRFQDKILEEGSSQIQYPLGMVRYVYFNFIISLPNIESQLKAFL